LAEDAGQSPGRERGDVSTGWKPVPHQVPDRLQTGPTDVGYCAATALRLVACTEVVAAPGCQRSSRVVIGRAPARNWGLRGAERCSSQPSAIGCRVRRADRWDVALSPYAQGPHSGPTGPGWWGFPAASAGARSPARFRPPRSLPIRGASVAPPSRDLRARSSGGASPALVGARWESRVYGCEIGISHQRDLAPAGTRVARPVASAELEGGLGGTEAFRSQVSGQMVGNAHPTPFPFATFFPRTGRRRFRVGTPQRSGASLYPAAEATAWGHVAEDDRHEGAEGRRHEGGMLVGGGF